MLVFRKILRMYLMDDPVLNLLIYVLRDLIELIEIIEFVDFSHQH